MNWHELIVTSYLPAIMAASVSAAAIVFSALSVEKSVKIAKESLAITRRLQEPSLSVYARESAALPGYMEIVVRNTGHTDANDVEFELDETLRDTFLPEAERNRLLKRATGLALELPAGGFLELGLVGLGPGSTRTYLWNRFDEILDRLGRGSARVTARYAMENDEEKLQSFRLRVADFVGSASREQSPAVSMATIAATLERINERLEQTEDQHV